MLQGSLTLSLTMLEILCRCIKKERWNFCTLSHHA